MGCLTYFFFFFVWWGVLSSGISPIMPKCSLVRSKSESIALPAEQRKELIEEVHRCTSDWKFAVSKTGLLAIPLSMITTHLTYKQR